MERVDRFEICMTTSGKDTKDAKMILLEMLRSLRPQERVVSFWKRMGSLLIHLPSSSSSILQLFFGASRRHAFKIWNRHTPRYLVFNQNFSTVMTLSSKPTWPWPADPFEYSKSEGCQVGEAVAGGSAVAECSRILPLRFRGWSSCVLGPTIDPMQCKKLV